MAVTHLAKKRKLSPPENGQRDGVENLSGDKRIATTKDDFFARAAGWNLEQSYERKPRKQSKKDKDNTRLPIKTAEGRVEPLQVSDVKGDDSEQWLSSEDEGGQDGQKATHTEAIEEGPKVPMRQQILDAKEELAKIASHINEDPEENAGGFRVLAQISSSPHLTIKKLGLATQLAVYKDAIPGYRIRPIAEADQTEKVSKEVRRLRTFEQSLVSAYQDYLKDLSSCAKTSSRNHGEDAAGLANVAISCACALLLAVPHFNFRGDLLKIIVGKLSTRRKDSDFDKCRETLETFFRNDDDGTPSLDAVTLMTKMMKARNYQIEESVLNTFLNLRLLSEFSSKASTNHVDKPAAEEGISQKKAKLKREFRTKKQRKILKERKVVEKEFKEADAIVSHEHRDRMQAETLKLVFVTYFRILKARIPHLMGAVLEGLAKYSHLINQDFFGDLLEALKDLINDAEAQLSLDEETEYDVQTTSSKRTRDPTRETLLCITTAFALLEGQDVAKSASSLSLDLTFFTTHLYKSLHALAVNPDIELSAKSLRLPDPSAPYPSSLTDAAKPPSKVNVRTTTVLLLRALSSVLKPRNVPPIRLAAFTKQLYTSSLHLPEKSNLALLGLMNDVAKTHGRKIASLWNTEERRGDGVFDPLRGDLEGSNPFAGTVWEGELLRLHFSPGVRDAVGVVERGLGGSR